MSGAGTEPGILLEDLAAKALGLSRRARGTILREMIPLLPGRDRAFARSLVVAIDRGRIFEDRFATDLETLVDLADAEIAKGTVQGLAWDASPEATTAGTWIESQRTPDAAALAVAAIDARDLLRAVGAVLDAAMAERICQNFRP